MMKKTSFWRLLGFMGAILLLLTACGKQGSAAKSSSSAPVKITYWHRMTGTYDKSLNKLITKFNNSQKKYKVVATSQGSYNALQQKIMAAGKSKTLPTMAQSPYTNIGDYVKNQLLLPFDSEMLNGSNKLSNRQLKDIYPSFLAAGKYDGKYYGLPFSVSTSVLFYNKKLMSQYNISMPKTWADFAADQDKLKGTDINAIELDQSYDVALEGMAYGAGSQLITPKLKANLNAPKTLAAVNQILDLRKSGALKTPAKISTSVCRLQMARPSLGLVPLLRFRCCFNRHPRVLIGVPRSFRNTKASAATRSTGITTCSSKALLKPNKPAPGPSRSSC